MDEFEYDDGKSKANLEKHGIDFQAAQELWKDPDLLEIEAKSDNERRFLVIRLHNWKTLVCCRHVQRQADSPYFRQAIPQERGRAI